MDAGGRTRRYRPRGVVPPLKHKHLGYYRLAAESASGWSWFQYDAVAVNALWFKAVGLMAARQLSIAGGLRALTDRVNAMEAAASREAVLHPPTSVRTLQAGVGREQRGLTAMFRGRAARGG